MAKIGRPGLSREKKGELWERWKGGQCAIDIARALEKTKGAYDPPMAARHTGRMQRSVPDRRQVAFQ